MDKREYIDDSEEAMRALFAGLMRNVSVAMPVVMSEDTQDGHRCVPQPSIKRAVTDPVTGQVTYEDHPVAPDVPIAYAGGGGVTATHPVKKGDEGVVVYADSSTDAPLQQGGTAQPIDNRQHHAGDGIYIPQIRSDPRKLQQVSQEAHHVRSDDKKHVSEVHPQNGVTHTSVDPSTPAASASFDPLSMATKFIRHAVSGVSGLLGQATNGGTTHDHGVTYSDGAFMRVANALHTILAHPTNGASMNAANGLHSVLANPMVGAVLFGNKGANTVVAGMSGVTLQSSSAISMLCPPGGLSMPAGSASSNIGNLGGDMTGTLPNPQVVSVLNVANAHMLPNAANDGAAAALVPPVAIGHLYRNGSVLMTRIA